MLQGTVSDGQPVEVAICGAEPAPHDAAMVWYRLEVWNAERAAWENPCIATSRVPSPRALVVLGVWDGTGARHDVPEVACCATTRMAWASRLRRVQLPERRRC